MSTIAATNLKNASSGSNNIVLGTSGQTTVNGDLLFNSGYGSAATAYGCRAWVNFDGTGTVAIRASGNVSSITDNGTGNYTVNFTTAMVDANYSVVGTADANSAAGPLIFGRFPSVRDVKTTSAVAIYTMQYNGTVSDSPEINIAIFR